MFRMNLADFSSDFLKALVEDVQADRISLYLTYLAAHFTPTSAPARHWPANCSRLSPSEIEDTFVKVMDRCGLRSAYELELAYVHSKETDQSILCVVESRPEDVSTQLERMAKFMKPAVFTALPADPSPYVRWLTTRQLKERIARRHNLHAWNWFCYLLSSSPVLVHLVFDDADELRKLAVVADWNRLNPAKRITGSVGFSERCDRSLALLESVGSDQLDLAFATADADDSNLLHSGVEISNGPPTPFLSILVLTSNPPFHPAIAVEEEAEKIKAVMGVFAEVRILELPDPLSLPELLEPAMPHVNVLHIAAHGSANRIVTTPDRLFGEDSISASGLLSYLSAPGRKEPTPDCIVFNACGVASGLNVTDCRLFPVVVASNLNNTEDSVAYAFADGFYRWLRRSCEERGSKPHKSDYLEACRAGFLRANLQTHSQNWSLYTHGVITRFA